MTAGDPSLTTANQQPIQSAPSEVTAQSGKGQAVRTALWAVGVTVLSNIANILKQFRDVLESVAQLQKFALEHRWISAIALSLLVIWGNILLFRFLYSRLRRRIPTAYTVLASVVCVGVVILVFVSNLFSLRSLLEGPVHVQQQLVKQLAATQDAYGGGFHNATTAEGSQDTWTTAQSLKAMMFAGSYEPVRVKQAFSYIENDRRGDGFTVYEVTDTRAFIRTEIAAWVAIAYLESISKVDIWTESERPVTSERIEDTLRTITNQQDRSSGGWSPVPNLAASDARTYATVMSVWALTEALLSTDVSVQSKRDITPAFEAGVSWLINHYESNLGWEENPKYPLSKPFPGLTYQVLFVMQRAQLVTEHNSFKDTETYRRIKREFRSTIHPAEIGDLTSVPTAYMMVGEHPCWVDVLSYPWSLSILPLLSADNDVPPEDRRYLRGLLRDELNKLPGLPSRLMQDETWKLAESLIGLSNFINSERVRK